MKLTSKRSQKSKRNHKSKRNQKANTSKQRTKIILDDKSLRLVSIAALTTEHIAKLTELYNNNSSTISIWTEEQIKQYVNDEKIQIKKPDIDRKYYGFCIFYNKKLAGYIIGKKTPLLEQKFLVNEKPNKFNLLIVIVLDKNFKNKGIGTYAINLFITLYSKKIAHLGNYARHAKLYADIAHDNTASIKVFEKNNFHYSHNIIITGTPYRRYSRLVFSS